MSGTTRPGTPGVFQPAAAAPCHDRAKADLFFPDRYTPATVAEAKGLCRGCPQAARCLEWVAGHPQTYGVFAGLTPRERGQLGEVTPGNAAVVLARLRAVEAFDVADKALRRNLKGDAPRQTLGAATLAWATQVLQERPDLVTAVVDGQLTLDAAAAQASGGRRAA